MTEELPAHRAAVTARSGDTHVIGEDGVAVNVDQAARVLRQAQDERSGAGTFGGAPQDERTLSKPAKPSLAAPAAPSPEA